MLLAHQGGWDEFLLVALPLVLIGLLLWVANRRVSAQLAAAAATAADPESTEDHASAGETTPDQEDPAGNGETGRLG